MTLHFALTSLPASAALFATAATLAAQQPAAGQAAGHGPPVRQLGPVVAKTTEPLATVAGIRGLPGGGVLVNDIVKRRVLLFDSTMTTFTVVADSTSSTANAYGPRPGGLIQYRGDSTLFVDAASLSMLVIDPAGKITRVMSVPRTQDASFLAGGAFGGVGFDAAGRLVYRSTNFVMPKRPPGGGGGGENKLPIMPQQPDTAPVLRVDLKTRQLDTAGFIKVPKVNMQVTQSGDGRIMMTSELNPLPLVDDWAVLSDGSIAFVRGRDYHIDWLNADGTRSSSPKMPFDWQRLSDDDKVAFIDSVKAVRARMAASGQVVTSSGERITMSAGEKAAGAGGEKAAAAGASPERQTIMVFGGAGGREGAPPGRPGAGPNVAGMTMPQVTFVSPSELPDYKPPFFAGSVRADADGNLWIRTIATKPVQGGPVYDVVNRRGELVDRVQMPAGRTIAGFGTGGVVYLGTRDDAGFHLERARVR
ncbi:MAG: hypothetical protein WKG32_05890 [Gemmatimonadaceae bacterium]